MITIGGFTFVKLECCNFPNYKVRVVWFGCGKRGILDFHGFDAYCINGLFELDASDLANFAHNIGYAQILKQNERFLTAS